MRNCDVCAASKTSRHKFYSDLLLLSIFIHYLKNLSIKFLTGLPNSINWMKNSYNSILVIVDWLTKMVHYKLVKTIINAFKLAKVIINMLIKHHNLSDLIVTNRGFFIALKFQLLLLFLKYKTKALNCI